MGEVVVHSLVEARAALKAARESSASVTLASAPGAGIYAGPAWWKALADAARAEFPDLMIADVLDCGDEAGAALGALRAGVRHIRFSGAAEAAVRLADIAARLGARVERPR